MMKEIFIFSLCIAVAYCAAAMENAPVTAKQKAQGYACKSRNRALGLMREGESKTNYVTDSCSKATCNGGIIYHESCGVMSVPGCNVQPDPSKPYPRCCHEYICI